MANNGCGCNTPFLLPGTSQGGAAGGAANIEIIGNPPIFVQTQQLSSITRYTISYLEVVALAGTLSISNVVTTPSGSAYLSGVLPLKGALVNDISLVWTLTKAGSAAQVASQALRGEPIDNTLRDYTFEDVDLEHDSLLADRTFTLVADDGLGNPGSSVNLSVVLNFGNKIYKVEGPLIEDDDLTLASMLLSGGFEIRQNKNTSFSPESLSPFVYSYIAIPAEFGATEFRDANSPILINPMRLLKTINLSNGILEYSYNIYVSKQGALRGALIQTV